MRLNSIYSAIDKYVWYYSQERQLILCFVFTFTSSITYQELIVALGWMMGM